MAFWGGHGHGAAGSHEGAAGRGQPPSWLRGPRPTLGQRSRPAPVRSPALQPPNAGLLVVTSVTCHHRHQLSASHSSPRGGDTNSPVLQPPACGSPLRGSGTRPCLWGWGSQGTRIACCTSCPSGRAGVGAQCVTEGQELGQAADRGRWWPLDGGGTEGTRVPTLCPCREEPDASQCSALTPASPSDGAAPAPALPRVPSHRPRSRRPPRPRRGCSGLRRDAPVQARGPVPGGSWGLSPPSVSALVTGTHSKPSLARRSCAGTGAPAGPLGHSPPRSRSGPPG